MSALTYYRNLLDAVVFRGTRIRNFIAVMGVKRSAGLAALLLKDDAEQLYTDVYGLHNLRWLLFDPNHPNGVSSIEESESQALVLSLVFDGNLDDILLGLLDAAGNRVREILSHGFGFSAGSDVTKYLKQRETPSGYFFRDLGPLIIPSKRSGAPQGKLQLPPAPDPTRAEILDAFAVQQRFERFYADHSHEKTTALRKAFITEFRNSVFPLPLMPFERRRSDEDSWMRRMMDSVRKLQDAEARRNRDRPMPRFAHAKQSALIEATFEVIAVDEAYRWGLFAKPAQYPLLMRTSDGSSQRQPDRNRDARGLALRVSIPDDSELAKTARYLDSSAPGQQDLVLLSIPVFPTPDVRTLAMWTSTMQLDGGSKKWAALLALVLRSGGLRQAGLFARMLATRIRHPLEVSFHSTTPYLLGPHHVAKYMIEPVLPQHFPRVASPDDPDALSRNLQASLVQQNIELKLSLHILPTNQVPPGFNSLQDVIEDATVDWTSLAAKKVHVANIRIPAQDPTTPERKQAAEAMDFNPWHSLEEHRPLGSLNRARWKAYGASQRHRAPQPQVALAPSSAAAAE